MNSSAAKPPARLLLAIVAVLALLFPLALAELGLRLAGFRYHLYPEKIQFGYPRPEHFTTLYQSDKERLWVRQSYSAELEKLRQAPPDLILMGDSCTEFGSYDEALRGILSGERPTANISLSKVGHGGWSSFQGLRQMILDVAPLKPKLATIYFGWNDHWVGFGIEDKDIARINSSLYVRLEKLRLVQLLAKAYIALTRDPNARLRRVALEDFRSNLREMVRVARENGIEPVLLTAPSSHRQGKEPVYLKRGWLEDLSELVPLHLSYVEAVREIAAETKAPLCDLFADFAPLPEEDLVKKYFKKDGIHLTKEGYELLAKYLYECLKPLLTDS